MMALAVAAALGSALLVATASVLQHRAGNSHAAPTLKRALRHPLWFLGALAGVSGFGLHVLALSQGALAVVQPLLVCGLLFAVPLSCLLDRRRFGVRDLVAAAAVVGGLVVFQTAARPSSGTPIASSAALGWCTALALTGAGVALTLAVRDRPRRPVWLGLCSGIGYGLVASLVKSTVGVVGAHGWSVLTTWPPYAFAVVVAGSIAVNQLAFNSGPLARSLPLITIVDPLVAVLIGAAAFGEAVTSTPGSVLAQVAGLVVTSTGVIVLARRSEPARAPARAGRPDTHLTTI